jgi:hypothetical protein
MQAALGLILLFLFATVAITFGCDRGNEYIGKVAANPTYFQLRLAKLDLLSYILTCVPLVGGLMILLGNDPNFIVPLKLPDGYRDFTTATLGLIASFGVGLGIARRSWVLRALKKKQDQPIITLQAQPAPNPERCDKSESKNTPVA